ncbi:type II toxin-antitoxin system HigB family toxin [Myroides sp. LJL116]
MRVIAIKITRSFWEKHADSEQQLKAWFQESERATWKDVNELKSDYPSASILKDNRICFNIKGNHFRWIAKINFVHGVIWIRFIGTYSQYDRISANTI